MPSDFVKIEVIVEYDGFIAGQELTEILEMLDMAIWEEIRYEFFIDDIIFGFPFLPEQKVPRLFCIEGVSSGSIDFHLSWGTVAIGYCLGRFQKGFKPARFGKMIERFGKFLGDNAEILAERFFKRIESDLEEYVHYAKRNESRIKNIKVRKKISHKKEE